MKPGRGALPPDTADDFRFPKNLSANTAGASADKANRLNAGEFARDQADGVAGIAGQHLAFLDHVGKASGCARVRLECLMIAPLVFPQEKPELLGVIKFNRASTNRVAHFSPAGRIEH